MKKALIFVPLLLLATLVAVGTVLYINSGERSGCTGTECDTLSDSEYLDQALEVRY